MSRDLSGRRDEIVAAYANGWDVARIEAHYGVTRDEIERLVASDDADSQTPAPAPKGVSGPGYGWVPGPGAYPLPYVLRRPMNNLAIAALVVGLVSLVSCPLIGAIAIYLGNRARAEIRTTGEDGDGLALAGVIVGWCAVGLALLLFVIYLGFFGLMFTRSN